jgi:outer membrane receptor protein involved in Fe transport
MRDRLNRLRAPLRRSVRWAGVVTLLTPSFAGAQPQHSVVSGRVLDPQGVSVPLAQVVLLDPLGQRIRATVADADGRFRLRGVPPGLYHLRAEATALRSASHRLAVGDGLPVTIDLVLSPQLDEVVTVGARPDGSGGASGTTLAGEAVRRMPSPLRGGALRAAVAATPGWTAEDNGLLHHRGTDDGLLFVVDGIPVYERLDPQFGAGFDPLAIGSVRVLTGYVPAEYGLRSGAVIEVRSETSASGDWSGAIETALGAHRGQALSALARGPVGRTVDLAATAGGERSHRFLDPVSLDNLHNEGAAGGGEAVLSWVPGASAVTLRAGHARSAFDVPHDPEQEEAGQDQRQRLEQTFATLDWQRAWSERTISHVALFARDSEGRLAGSAADTPVTADSAREQDRFGVLAAATHERGRHRLKLGGEASRIRLDERFSFAVTDHEQAEDVDLSDAARRHDRVNPFVFSGRVRRPVFSAYVQDSWRASDRLTIDAGLRYDHSRLLLAESQWSPRLGVSYRAGPATLRASANRFFQPPQTEHLLLSSSPAARRLSPFVAEVSAGGAEIPAERQTAIEAGAEWWIGGAIRADVAVWRRGIRHQGDPNVFFGTTIVFPNSVARGIARGLDLRLEWPRRSGLSASLTYTLAKVDQYGPITGGLFLEDDVIEIGPGTPFTPDHDQRHALSAEVGYQHDGRGLWLSASGRFRTGTPLEVDDDELDDLRDRPGADLVDFDQRRVRPHATLDLQAGQRLLRRGRLALSARAALLNVTGARYAYNFGNPFSGTHFGAARSLRVDFRLSAP